MSEAKPSSQRVQALRDRRRAAGLIKIERWVKPEWIQAIDEFIKKLEKDSK
jgi:hypothetical protein